MAGEPQGWLDLDRYLAAHDRMLDAASAFFVEDPTSVSPEFLFEGTLRIHGDLLCRGGLLLHVDKYFDIDDGNRIRGFRYRYHAQFAARPLRQIFRYDNDHIYAREGHPDAFHKHVFNDRTWKELEVVHIGREAFPTLLEVVDELYDWWLRKRDDPLIYP